MSNEMTNLWRLEAGENLLSGFELQITDHAEVSDLTLDSRHWTLDSSPPHPRPLSPESCLQVGSRFTGEGGKLVQSERRDIVFFQWPMANDK